MAGWEEKLSELREEYELKLSESQQECEEMASRVKELS